MPPDFIGTNLFENNIQEIETITQKYSKKKISFLSIDTEPTEILEDVS